MPDLLDQIVDTGVHPAAVDCSLTLLLCGQRVQSDSRSTLIVYRNTSCVQKCMHTVAKSNDC